jgi:hypothetical protein
MSGRQQQRRRVTCRGADRHTGLAPAACCTSWCASSCTWDQWEQGVALHAPDGVTCCWLVLLPLLMLQEPPVGAKRRKPAHVKQVCGGTGVEEGSGWGDALCWGSRQGGPVLGYLVTPLAVAQQGITR